MDTDGAASILSVVVINLLKAEGSLDRTSSMSGQEGVWRLNLLQ